MLGQLKSRGYSGSLILLVILLWTGISFSNSIKNDFIASWDDKVYILDNHQIKEFSLQSIQSIFSTFHAANYHPLTTFSWAIEYRLFGINPTINHITNLAFHLLNTFLVFHLIILLTRNISSSAIVAFFFAMHPMHVEAVSFISQRKDVLYTCFYLASLISYVYYIKDGQRTVIMAVSFLFFGLSLLSKSMAVTLPMILLLLDYYLERPFSWRCIIEKTPFFALSLVFGILALLSQRAFGAITNLPAFSLFERVFLVSYSFLFYILKLFAPLNLSAMYYYPTRSADGLLPVEYYLAPVVTLLIIWGIFKAKRFRKELLFGLGFYLVTISLVLQIIPVGSAIVAERYTYVPYIGLFLIIGQFYSALAGNTWQSGKTTRRVLLWVLIGYAAFFTVTTWHRNTVWENSLTLWSDVIEKNPLTTVAYYNRGVARFNMADFRGAIDDYSKALELKPDYTVAYNNRGESKAQLQNHEGAIEDFNEAAKLKPDYTKAYFNRANTKNRLKNYAGAVDDFSKAISIRPDYVDAYFGRANSRSRLKDYEGAVSDLSKVIELRRDSAVAYNNRGIARAILGNYREAVDDFNTAIQLKPNYKEANDNLERARSRVTHNK